MTTTIEPTKVGEYYRVILNSQNATMNADNSFKFDVNFKDIDGDVIRCGVKKVVYPPPATYITRRLWFADGNSWKNSFTDPQGKVNDYDALFAKYGVNNWVYVYYPLKNMYVRWFWTVTENTQIRQTVFSTSVDGVNWSSNSNLTPIGLLINVDWSGTGSVPFDCYEIDITTLPFGTNLQNIHIPQLTPWRSWDTIKQGTTDILSSIVKDGNANSYVSNDLTISVKDTDVRNEVNGSSLRTMRNMTVYFSRVATPTVKEPVVMPWSLVIDMYAV
jgi:hypothetical protein